MRRLWPDLLEQVKTMRRFTWILLSQNAQVLSVDATTLTIGFKNAGARESFLGGGSEEILRQAAIEVVGADWRIETAVDPSTEPGGQPRVTRPAVPPPPEAPADEVPAPRPVRPAAAEEARASLARAAERPVGEAPPPGPDLDADADRDDPTSADDGLDSAELLQRELGATVIDETPH